MLSHLGIINPQQCVSSTCLQFIAQAFWEGMENNKQCHSLSTKNIGKGEDMTDEKSHPELQQFFLHDSHVTEREIGRGAYGSVVEVEIPGAVCVAKRIHEELLRVGLPDEVQHMTDKFIEECRVLSSLRHPHIVQFLGICQIPGCLLPALVMEKLDRCLHSFLESTPAIPLCAKLSILRDISRGLVYLHSHRPPIIHRDFTARNVLLTSSLVAKISDLGMARIVGIPPGQLANTMTRAPGNITYMPPEALERSPKYDTALDIFSFGNLALFILTQQFPEPKPAAYTDLETCKLIARSELERRMETIHILYQDLGTEHPLVSLVQNCLKNFPKDRPTATQLLESLTSLILGTPNDIWDMNKTEMFIDILHKEEQLKDLQAQNDLMRLQNQKDLEIKKKEELEFQQQALQQLELQVQEKCIPQGYLANQLSKELEDTDAFPATEQVLEELDRLCTQEVATEDYKDNPKPKNTQTHVKLTHKNIRFKWKSGFVHPHKLVAPAKAVVLNDMVYVNDSAVVRVYSTEINEWDRLHLIPNSYTYPTILVHNEKLVAVVLVKKENGKEITGKVAVWDDDKWIYPYPPRPTPRQRTSLASYKNFIIVAGGLILTLTPSGGVKLKPTQIVEILDTDTSQWFTAEALPMHCLATDAVIINDTLYLAGGFIYKFIVYTYKAVYNTKILAVSLPALIAQATSGGDNPASVSWEFLTDTPLMGSTLFRIGNVLGCAGGLRKNSAWKFVFESSPLYQICNEIYVYSPEARSWSLVGRLPIKCSNMIGTVLNSGEILLFGGTNDMLIDPKKKSGPYQYSDRMYIADIL